MIKKYTVSETKTKTGEIQYYCHKTGFAYIPVIGSFGSKRHAKSYAAMYNNIPNSEYKRKFDTESENIFFENVSM